MVSIIVAVGIAFGAESVDNIFGKRGSSCSNGSCSVAPVQAKPAAAPVTKAPAAATESSCCSSSKTRTGILNRSCGSRKGRCR